MTHRITVRHLVIPALGAASDFQASRCFPHDHRAAPLAITTGSRSWDDLAIRLIVERGYQVLVIDCGAVHPATAT